MRDSLNKYGIEELREKGKRIHCRFAGGYYKAAEKIGLTVVASKKLGSSVTRNRIKRRLRQALRNILKETKGASGKDYQVVLYAKIAVLKAKFEDLQHSLETALGMI